MNLNISTQIMSNFQGNNISSGVNGSSNDFMGLFKSIENIEDSKDINYDLILSLFGKLNNLFNSYDNELGDLSNLQSINLENLNSSTNKDINLEKLMDVLNSINERSNGSVSKDSKKLFNNIIDMIQSKNINMNDINSMDLNRLRDVINKNTYNESDISENSEVKKSDFNINKYSNLGEKLNLEDLRTDKFSELEISSLSNKNNMLGETKINSDKDLSTLESILDNGDNNSFIIQGNTTSNVSSTNEESITNKTSQVIRQDFVGEDIVKTVKYLKSNGLEEIKIKISPRELGEMTIKLIKNDNEATLHINISREEVYELVNKNIGDITKHLNEVNIKVKDVVVNINGNENVFSDNLNQEYSQKEQESNNKREKYNKSFNQIEDIIEDNIIEDRLNILI